jgi:CheY-like chemotaxis protein
LIKAKRSHPDILIIDVNMPEADGLSVCARLLDPAKRALNVVVVTGSQEQQTVERCEGFGAFYVRKGPDFWNGLASALIETFPLMADRIKKLQVQPRHAEIRKRPRVLVIDSDPDIGKFFTGRLGKCSVDTLCAPDASQGYRLACKEEPSVIISDYLPNGDLQYLLVRLRTTTVTENIPVFMLTGARLSETDEHHLTREVCGHAGVVQIFRKSFDTDGLFVALQKLCGFEYNRVDE